MNKLDKIINIVVANLSKGCSTLYLEDNELTDEDMLKLLPYIQGNMDIDEVRLSGNKLSVIPVLD